MVNADVYGAPPETRGVLAPLAVSTRVSSKLRQRKCSITSGTPQVIDQIEASLPFKFIKVHHNPDGTFPNGVPNPLLEENRQPTIDAIRRSGADVGIAWDGDFDRWIERIPNAPADLKLVARIEFEIPGAPNGLGYPVEILTRVCRAYIRAEREGRLHHKQRHIADQAWRLLEALGDVGLVALVDEATGYQNARAANDLQNRLALYLLPTPGRWEVTFPPEFYKLVARLYRVRLLHPSRRPQFFANFTREYVYAPAMGADVSQAMAARNPDPAHGHNHHQLLTGPARAMVLEQRNRVMTLLRQSSTPDEFRARYRVEFHGAPLQLALVN